MSSDEPLELQGGGETRSISSAADDFGRTFVKRLEQQYAELVSELSEKATWLDFQEAMMRAIGIIFEESGAASDIVAPLREMANRLVPLDTAATWNRDKNARRLGLIDKKIQQTITAEEESELARA